LADPRSGLLAPGQSVRDHRPGSGDDRRPTRIRCRQRFAFEHADHLDIIKLTSQQLAKPEWHIAVRVAHGLWSVPHLENQNRFLFHNSNASHGEKIDMCQTG